MRRPRAQAILGLAAQAILGLALAAAALAGCGSSSRSGTSPAGSGPSSRATTTSPGSLPAAVGTGPVHAVLSARNHSPVAGRDWAYSVHVTDSAGKPLAGTVKIQFAFGNQVVGTDHPAVHPLRHGVWHDTLTFPKDAVGYPLTFEAVVRTSAGSVTLGWPVTVRP